MKTFDWRRSSRCSTGACIFVASTGDTVLVRDDKNADSPVLKVDRAAWRDLIDDIRAGRI